MNSLSKDELEAVLAHELTHILNRDVRLLIVTVIFTGMIGFAAQLVWSSIRYGLIFGGGGRGNNRGGGVIIMLAIAVVLWVGYMATLLMRFALSRRREFMADAGAVELTKNPSAMMRALMRIAGRDQIQAPRMISPRCALKIIKRFLVSLLRIRRSKNVFALLLPLQEKKCQIVSPCHQLAVGRDSHPIRMSMVKIRGLPARGGAKKRLGDRLRQGISLLHVFPKGNL